MKYGLPKILEWNVVILCEWYYYILLMVKYNYMEEKRLPSTINMETTLDKMEEKIENKSNS